MTHREIRTGVYPTTINSNTVITTVFPVLRGGLATSRGTSARLSSTDLDKSHGYGREMGGSVH